MNPEPTDSESEAFWAIVEQLELLSMSAEALALIDKTLDNIETIRCAWAADEVEALLVSVRLALFERDV
ncbi:hypothetical protein [Microbacterium oxydans]|uniref:hypothetical protein n=1 Tax=Microbacterium oxydans TaxID=82380 RepID=UPI0022B0AB1E|nr:hypothetical protein [Microbacterium oxydans]MCZ4301268.1 hypothetical protein [Microbacterium oxydans]